MKLLNLWKKFIIFLFILLLLIFSFIYLIFNHGTYYKYLSQANQNLDLSYCDKIPFYKLDMKYYSGSFGILPGHYAVRSQREICHGEVKDGQNIIGDENFYIYAKAIKENNPELCLDINSDVQKNIIVVCLDKLIQINKDPSICKYYPDLGNAEGKYKEYWLVFGCQSYLIAIGKQNATYCDQFEPELKNYCYFAVTWFYVSDRRPSSSELRNYPTPDFPYVCDKINPDHNQSCVNAYNEFDRY